MRYSLRDYIVSKDWRLIVIEFVSLLLAILSAWLLESKFFQIFIESKYLAAVFAVVVVFSVTFSAYVAADNLQSKRKGWKRNTTILFFVTIYAAIITALLGMSNYTMTVLKARKDVNKLESKISSVDELPVVIESRKELAATELSCNNEINRLQQEIDGLIEREKITGLTYVTKKQNYEALIRNEKDRLEKSRDKFSKIRDREEIALSDREKQVATAGQDDAGIGKFLSKNPAILPVLALIVLFVGRLTFSAMQNVTTETLAATKRETRPETSVTLTKTTVKHTSVTFAFPHTIEGWQSAIGTIVDEKKAGNGKNLVSATARYFRVNKGIVSRAVTHALRGEPINVPTKLLIATKENELQAVSNETQQNVIQENT